MLLPTQYDVGVDNNDFTPVSFAQVKAIIGKQIEQSEMNKRKIIDRTPLTDLVKDVGLNASHLEALGESRQ